jgi:hypothetical protein
MVRLELSDDSFPVVMLLSSGKREAAAPWLLLSTSILIIAITDGAFGYLVTAFPDDEI